MKDCSYNSQCQTAQRKKTWSILVKSSNNPMQDSNTSTLKFIVKLKPINCWNHGLDVHDSFRQDSWNGPISSAFVLSSRTSFMGNFCSTDVESWETFLFLECLSHSIKVQVCLTRRETVWKPSGQMEKMHPRIIVMLDWVSKETIHTAPYSHYTTIHPLYMWRVDQGINTREMYCRHSLKSWISPV